MEIIALIWEGDSLVGDMGSWVEEVWMGFKLDEGD